MTNLRYQLQLRYDRAASRLCRAAPATVTRSSPATVPRLGSCSDGEYLESWQPGRDSASLTWAPTHAATRSHRSVTVTVPGFGLRPQASNFESLGWRIYSIRCSDATTRRARQQTRSPCVTKHCLCSRLDSEPQIYTLLCNAAVLWDHGKGCNGAEAGISRICNANVRWTARAGSGDA